MWPFRKDGLLLPPSAQGIEIYDPSELNKLGHGDDEIQSAIKKSHNFLSYQDDVEDSGGFFGEEFSIRTSASRIKSTYSREPWVYATASLVARTMASVPMRVRNKQTKEVVENSPIEAILNSGGLSEDPLHTRWSGNLDLVLGGNAFFVFSEDFRDVVWIPTELITLDFSTDGPPESITIQRNVSGGVSAVTIPKSHYIHLKLPNPFSPFFGMSAYAAASRPIILDRYQSEFEMAWYLRGGTNSGVIETSQDIGKNRMQRLMKTYEAAFTGKRNWWRTLFLPKGAKWITANMALKDMLHIELKKDNRGTLLAVLNIPPSKMGILDDVNRATSEDQDKQFWESTIVPYVEFQASGWNASEFMRIRNPTLEVFPDTTGIEALEGSTIAKGERSKAMEQTHHIDEIRATVWGDDPLPNGEGEQFFAQVRGQGSTLTGLGLSMKGTQDDVINSDNLHAIEFDREQFDLQTASRWMENNDYPKWIKEVTSDIAILFITQDGTAFVPDSFARHKIEDGVHAVTGRKKNKAKPDDDLNKLRTQNLVKLKKRVIDSQDRIERSFIQTFSPVIAKAIKRTIQAAIDAINDSSDVRKAIEAGLDERMALYWDDAEPVLNKGMDRGFSLMTAQTNQFIIDTEKSSKKDINARFNGFSDLDLQAIEVLRERDLDGNRTTLAREGLLRFQSFDDTLTEGIMNFIEEGLVQGQGMMQIAQRIRSEFGEAYRNQARTIVRTEVLSAVSKGIEANGEVLGEVFSSVDKQWISSGKPTSRPDHITLEEQGPIPKDQAWVTADGDELNYPRDSKGGAKNIVNCGCSQSFVIPDGAESNAAAILETES